MKRFLFSLIALVQTMLLLGHGFSADTLVLLADNAWQQISTVCYRTQKKKIAVASYDTVSSYQTTAKTVRGGRSKSNCYISFAFADELRRNHHAIARERATAGGFEEDFQYAQCHHVACTPTQEFYSATTHQWVPAYKIKIGDELLCANNVTKKVTYIALIKEPLDLFTIEVKHTHTFFVTEHSLLTHNMVIPIAFNIGLSVPFGASAGSVAGGFFGPVTFVIGAAIGCAVGVLVKMICNSKIPTYAINAYNTDTFERYIKQQPQITTLNEPQVALSPDYRVIQPNTLTLASEACIEYTCSEASENTPCLSTVIENPPPKEKPGCGDTTPQKSLILITPGDPMLVFQNPGYSALPEKDKAIDSHSGCGVIPDHLTDLLNKPLILTDDNNADEKVNGILEGATYVGQSNEKTKIYVKPKEYEDAIKDFESMELDGVKNIRNGDVFVGSLPDGRQVNVRKTSKGNYKGEDKWPTLEIKTADGKRSKIKIRYTKANT